MIYILCLILLIGQLTLPRSIGFVPLVLAGSLFGNVEILPELTPVRLIIAAGLVRACINGFFKFDRKSRLDLAFLWFSLFLIISSVGHVADEWFPNPTALRAGLAINAFGTYLYGRAFLPDVDSFKRYAKYTPVLLLPLAIGMIAEKRSGKNAFHGLGAVHAEAISRDGKIRAQGPFRHPILAGTAGGTAVPFGVMMWKLGERRFAVAAILITLSIVICSASSGPLATVAVVLLSVAIWKWRKRLPTFIWIAILMALLYTIIKQKGPWYIMSSIDLVGGSTGWHRAKLMDQGFIYINEWWLVGSDYTRHWMASGVRWNPNHVDLTNYYLHLGVTGGIALPICMFYILYKAINGVYKVLVAAKVREVQIICWYAIAAIATHAISFLSISYFDQMYVYFYILIGAVPGLVAANRRSAGIIRKGGGQVHSSGAQAVTV